MLEVANLSLAYGQHRALDGVALNVGRGEIVTILGANGAGKTSLLKAIAGVVRTLPGKQVSLAGRDISALPAHEIVESGLALVPEGRGIFGDLTVKENLLLGANPKRARDGRSRAARTGARAVSAPARTRRPDRAHHERRRTADARHRPRADVQPGYPCCSTSRRSGSRPPWCRSCSPRCGGCARPASDCCSSSRTRRRACGSPTAAMCSKTASSSGTAPPINLKADPAVQRAYLGGALPAAITSPS